MVVDGVGVGVGVGSAEAALNTRSCSVGIAVGVWLGQLIGKAVDISWIVGLFTTGAGCKLDSSTGLVQRSTVVSTVVSTGLVQWLVQRSTVVSTALVAC